MAQRNRQEDSSRATTTTQTPFERFMNLPIMQDAHLHPGNYYMVCCPVEKHQDKTASLLVREDEDDGHVVLRCFGACSREEVCAALEITESSLYKDGKIRYSAPSSGPQRKLTLLDIAMAKLIDPRILAMAGVEDGYTYRREDGTTTKNIVRIVYHNEDGSPRPKGRVRATASAQETWWDGLKTDKISPYGLERLDQARQAGYLWIPEGESDCWTFWMHGEPSLGIPGAGNTKLLKPEHVQGIQTLYLIREPITAGKRNDAGKSFIDGLRERLQEFHYQGEVFVVALEDSHNVKDPNELHQKLFREGRLKEFKAELKRAIHEAMPLDLLKPETPTREKLEEVQQLVTDAIAKAQAPGIYALVPRIAGLESQDQFTVISQIDAASKAIPGFAKRNFNTLLTEERDKRKQKNKRVHRPQIVTRRDIILTGDAEDDREATLGALYAANNPPTLFIRGAKMARCRTSEEGRPFIEEVTTDILLFEMSRVARFLTYSEKKDTLVSVYPPTSVARSILAAGNWRFPALRGIQETPIVREDGSIQDKPGYDPDSRMIYLSPPGMVIPPIPVAPTQKEIEDAREYIWQFFAQFNYESQADAANAMGALLTTVTRSMYDLCPMFLIDGVKPGCGKSLWVQSLMAIALGRMVASSPMPQDEAEWGKTLTSHLMAGNTYLSLDNIRGLLKSAQLEMFLTSPSWVARVLGTMQTPELIQRTLVVGNGNNLEIGGDLPRRCVRVRLTTMTSTPWMESNFKFSPLLTHVLGNRGEIIKSLLTLVRAWVVAGKPVPASVPPLGTFSGWSHTIGGILAFAGVPGFLDNLVELYQETDTESPQWAAFLEWWEQNLPGKAITVAEVVEALKKDKDFAELLPDPLGGAWKEEAKNFSIRLGKALRFRKGTPYGPHNTHLVRGEDRTKKIALWSVASRANAGTKPRLWVITGGKAVDAEGAGEREPAAEEPPTETTLFEAEEAIESNEREEEAQEPPPVLLVPVEQRCHVQGCQQPHFYRDDTSRCQWCEEHMDRAELVEIGQQLDYPQLDLGGGHAIVAERHYWILFAKNSDDGKLSAALHTARQLKRKQEEDQGDPRE